MKLEKIQSLYYAVAHYGIEEKTPADTFAVITNHVAIVAFFSGFFFNVIFFLAGNYLLCGWYVVFHAVCLLVPYLNSKRLYSVAKFILVISIYLTIVLASVFNGPEIHAQWYLLLVPIISFVIFEPKQTKEMFFAIFLLLPAYFGIIYLYTVIPSFGLSQGVVAFLQIAIYFMLIGTIVLFVYLFRATFLQLKEEVEKAHKNTQESIRYASLIQQAFLPEEEQLEPFFSDIHVLWQPRDTVGGDIYFFQTPKRDEVYVMLFDGAGHGVGGAFVTMLLKAIQTELAADLLQKEIQQEPGFILSHYNRRIKTMLGEKMQKKSNIGCDAGILYYNKQKGFAQYAGAKIDLYMYGKKGLEKIQGSRKSVGFSRIEPNQHYQSHTFEVQKGMRLFLATDGFFDQENEQNKRFLKSGFEASLKKGKGYTLQKQATECYEALERFRGAKKQNDDITLIALEI